MQNKILVIEDNQENMRLIVDCLLYLNYIPIQATNGNLGVELAHTESPDLILLDLSLPLKDGWAVAQEVKADPVTNHIPIIALTAHAMIGDRERALEAGCNDYLTKPIELTRLANVLNKYLYKSL